MQEIIIVAGPNGAGKTSFANEFLPADVEGLVFVNADEVARVLARDGLKNGALDIAAGKHVLREMDRLVEAQREFLVETTLATTTYARRIPKWKRSGYWVSLIYLRLPSAEHSIERVRRRVAAGGHDIPEQVIRRRFVKSLENLEMLYKPLVDDWSIWDSLEGDFQIAETWED